MFVCNHQYIWLPCSFSRENDIADIAKQSGIELNEAEDEVFITMPKKKEKKKKEKAGYQKLVDLCDFGTLSCLNVNHRQSDKELIKLH